MEITNTIVLLQPGMYILRYPKGAQVPLAVCRAPSSADSAYCGRIERLSTPNAGDGVLRNGGDCIVMHVLDAPVELLISARAVAGEAAPALRIDQIALETAEAAPVSARRGGEEGTKHFEIGPNGISLIGHVELVGDVLAEQGQTLGDPSKNNRLEGFQIMWPDRPDEVDLACGIVVEGVGAVPPTKSGNYCGTRGQARRITELTLSLIGKQADTWQLAGTAYFSGGFALPVESGVPLGGPSGVEHLTALTLKALPRSGKAANPWNESAKTKVFKAKTSAGGSKKAETKAAKSK